MIDKGRFLPALFYILLSFQISLYHIHILKEVNHNGKQNRKISK